DTDARLWDAATGKTLYALAGHRGAVNDAQFSPDGRWIVTAGPSTAGLWDAQKGERLFFMRGHDGPLTTAAFDPSGRRIVTAGRDGTIRTYTCAICGGVDELIALAEQRQRSSGRIAG